MVFYLFDWKNYFEFQKITRCVKCTKLRQCRMIEIYIGIDETLRPVFLSNISYIEICGRARKTNNVSTYILPARKDACELRLVVNTIY